MTQQGRKCIRQMFTCTGFNINFDKILSGNELYQFEARVKCFSKPLLPSSGNDVTGERCKLFICISKAPSHTVHEQWGIVDEPISKPFSQSPCTWNFRSECPKQCCLKTDNRWLSVLRKKLIGSFWPELPCAGTPSKWYQNRFICHSVLVISRIGRGFAYV